MDLREEAARIIWSDGTGDEEGFETLSPKNITFKITDQILSKLQKRIEASEMLSRDEKQRILKELGLKVFKETEKK